MKLAQVHDIEVSPDDAQDILIDQFSDEASLSETTELQTTTSVSHEVETPSGLAAGAQALGIDGKLLTAKIVNFIILVFVLRKFVYQPLLGLLEKRRQTIEERMKKAEEIETRFSAFKEEHKKR